MWTEEERCDVTPVDVPQTLPCNKIRPIGVRNVTLLQNRTRDCRFKTNYVLKKVQNGPSLINLKIDFVIKHKTCIIKILSHNLEIAMIIF